MKKDYLKIISRILALLVSIIFGFILFLLLFNIQYIFNTFFLLILITSIFIFITSIYHLITGKQMKLFIFILLVAFIVFVLKENGYIEEEPFTHKISSNIELQLTMSKHTEIDLSKVIKSNFERVCIFGPYSHNERVESLLGFKWDIETKTSIHLGDSHNVLIFVKDKQIVDYVKHPRNLGDFSSFSGQCFEKFNSKFIRTHRRGAWIHENIYSPNK